MKRRQGLYSTLFVATALMVMLGSHHQVVLAQEGGRVFIRILDTAGSPVTDLTAEDFVIRQSDTDCTVVRVELSDVPLRVAFLVDDADGADDYFQHLRRGLPMFLDALPETSEVAFILLSGRARVVVNYEDGLPRAKKAAEEFFVQRRSPAAFFAGVRETVDRFERDNIWPVIALVTTDGPSMNRTSYTQGKYEALMDQIQERAVTVHALVLSTLTGDGFQSGIARDLTGMTGGWLETLNSPSQALGERLVEMAAEISERHAAASPQYMIEYESPPGVDPSTPISAGVRRDGLTLAISSDGRPQPTAQFTSRVTSTSSSAVATDEGSREGFWNAGEVAFANGNVDEAAEWYEKAHEADPSWGKPLFKLALVSLNKGDTETAVKYFEQVVEVDPDSEEGAQATGLITQLK